MASDDITSDDLDEDLDDEDFGDEDLDDEDLDGDEDLDDEELDGDDDEVAEVPPSRVDTAAGVAAAEAIISPVIEEFGLELYDIELTTRRGRLVLEVVVDRPGGRAEPGQGVTLEELIEVNRELSAVLDVDDPLPCRYMLEVNSPGVERSLTRRRHFEGSAGEAVHVVFNRIIDGHTAVDGTLVGIDDADEIRVRRADGSEVAVDLESIKSARTVYDWAASRGQKKGQGRKKKKKRKD